MSNNKQSSVEWFQEQIIKIVNGTCLLSEIEIFEQAKAMHKEQEYETKVFWFGRGVLAGREDRITELKPKRDEQQ